MDKTRIGILVTICCMCLSGCGDSENDLSADNEYAEFSLPNYSLASEIPVPDSLYGSMELAMDDVFSATIADVSSDGFNSYVDDCIEAGYSTDSSRFDDFYMAYNDSNIHLIIDYSEDDQSMSITVSKSEDADEAVHTQAEIDQILKNMKIANLYIAAGIRELSDTVIADENMDPDKRNVMEAKLRELSSGDVVKTIEFMLEDKNRDVLDQATIQLFDSFRQKDFTVEGEAVPISRYLTASAEE